MTTETLSFDVAIQSPATAVLDALWDVRRWPEVAPHVVGIDMLYEDDETQVLVMTVVTKKRTDRFKTVRVRQGSRIVYLQPNPPAFLLRHGGAWEVSRAGDGALLTSRHDVAIDAQRARHALEEIGRSVTSDEEATGGILEVIRHNSLQTMLGLQRRLEGEGK